MPKRDFVQIVDEVSREAKEHEVFLEFINDEDAINFITWWNLDGFEQFTKWVVENGDSSETD